MKKNILYLFLILLCAQLAFADESVFDSMDKAVEVKLAPAINTSSSSQKAETVKNTSNVNAIYSTSEGASLKEEKFNNALVNLDDAQVELRQELAVVTSKYNAALLEKEKAVANCKQLKKEINDINKKMRYVDKSKKMINKNLEVSK